MPAHAPVLLVLRALGLGDLLVSVPALRALRRAFPDHRLVYAGPSLLYPVLELIGGIDRVLPVAGLDQTPLWPGGAVDIAVNLHGRGPQSSALLDSLGPERRIGHCAPGWPGPVWAEGVHERRRWTSMLQWHGIAADPDDFRLERPPGPAPVPGAAVLHVGAAHGSRQWPTERFAAVGRALTLGGSRVVLTGSEGERSRALEVAAQAGIDSDAVLAGRLDLGEFAAQIADAAVLVSADTGAAHLASAFGTPSVVLFGPASVEQWGPPDGPHVVLTDSRRRRGDLFSEDPDPALLAVSAGDVLGAVARLAG